jgi:hypothetical protein
MPGIISFPKRLNQFTGNLGLWLTQRQALQQGLDQGFFFSDISHLSDGLGQCSGVPPNLSLRSDSPFGGYCSKKKCWPGPHLVAYPVACYDSPLTAKLSLV